MVEMVEGTMVVEGEEVMVLMAEVMGETGTEMVEAQEHRVPQGQQDHQGLKDHQVSSYSAGELSSY